MTAMQRHQGQFVWDPDRHGYEVSGLDIVDVPPDRPAFLAENAESLYVHHVTTVGGLHGFQVTGRAIGLQWVEAHNVAQSCFRPHGTKDTDLGHFAGGGAGVGGVHVQGPSANIHIHDGTIDGINADGGVSADAVTAYDAGNRQVHVDRVTVKNVHQHHGFHLSGHTLTIARCKAYAVDPRHALYMLGHTKAPGDGLRGYHATLFANVGLGGHTSSYGIWIRHFSNVQILAGTYQDCHRGLYMEHADNVVVDGGVGLYHHGTAIHRTGPGDLTEGVWSWEGSDRKFAG